MSKQTIALAYTQPEEALEEAQYQALVAALSANARGRAFLAEHARRSRSAETTTLLNAITRVGAQVRPQGPPREPIRAGLRTLLAELHTARAAIEANDAPPEADELNTLLDRLQTQLTDLLAPAKARSDHGGPPPIREVAVPAAPEPPSAAHWLDAPPEPAPPDNDMTPPPRPVALDIEANPPRLPPVANLDPAAPVFEIEAEIKAVIDAEVESRTKKPPAENAGNVLAAIMALSEEERIALFT